jgi:hypothetical protein
MEASAFVLGYSPQLGLGDLLSRGREVFAFREFLSWEPEMGTKKSVAVKKTGRRGEEETRDGRRAVLHAADIAGNEPAGPITLLIFSAKV